MNLGFNSPPKATRTIEMSNNRVTIINPLSHPASSGAGSHNAPPNSLQQSYTKYGANGTHKANTPSNFIIEPLLQAASSHSEMETSMAGTSTNIGPRLEFPSSALELYTTLLQDIEHGATDPIQDLGLSPPKEQVQTSAYEQAISTQGIDGIMSEVGDYLPEATGQFLTDTVLNHQNVSIGADSEDLSVGLPEERVGRSEPSIEVTRHSFSTIDLGNLGSGTQTIKKGDDSSCVDRLLDTVDTLPEVVENVSQAQRHQLLEVTRQQEILQQVKEQLVAEKESEDDLVVEVSACKRNICLTEDKGAQLQTQCKQLEKDMINAMTEDFETGKKCRDEEEKLTENKRLYEQYRCKMDHHKQAVAEVEATMDINIEVHQQLEMIASLHAEKAAMESHIKEDSGNNGSFLGGKLQQDINALTAEKKVFADKIRQQELETRKESIKQGAINQDIDVLHKRNQAQLKRLKKQLKEARLRNRQWNEEACKLERHLEELRKSMEE